MICRGLVQHLKVGRFAQRRGLVFKFSQPVFSNGRSFQKSAVFYVLKFMHSGFERSPSNTANLKQDDIFVQNKDQWMPNMGPNDCKAERKVADMNNNNKDSQKI